MKKILLLFLLSPLLSKAQAYVPFISTSDSSDVWMDVYSCTDFSCYFTSIKRYTIEGDTVIGSYPYAKLYVKEKYELGADQSQWCTESVNYYDYYRGAIREEAKQLFFKEDGIPEYMAYDFNLIVGDTVPSPANEVGNVSWRVIDSITQVLVAGVNRKCYWLNSGDHIVEGIGASTGLFNPIYHSGMCWPEMLCYAENFSVVFFDFGCDLNLSVPNISSNNSPPELVKIVDYLGREIDDAPNTVMIYIYSDGTSRKVFRLE